MAGERLHYLPVTPSMKKSAKLFKSGGMVEPYKHTGVIGDAEKAKRRSLMIARGFHKAEGGDVESKSFGGLNFPEDESAFRLRAKLNREQKTVSGKPESGFPKNPRTIVRAPKESDLPDFVVGDVNFNDWKNRHEKILTPAEINSASKWYKNIYANFNNYFGGDSEKSKKYMRAWLVAQQNVSPAGAMNNVLLQNEQMARNVPQHLWRAAGMPNPTEAARSVLQQSPITGGVGQKIADFVDAAEEKNVRSWMGNKPEGGEPFVVDVHTARDSGMVDDELINHLRRLGYNENDLSKLKVDLKGSPTEAAYENRAVWGRNLTKHLNDVGWMGKKNWTPSEIQAVGWMGMTKLTRNAEEDSESGLERNLRRISYGIVPGEGSPWEAKYKNALSSLGDEHKKNINQKITESAMRHASELAGLDLNNLVHGTGAWEKYQNPATVAHTLATEQGADIAAHALGYLLNQTEVWHNRTKPMTQNPKGFAVDFIEHGSTNLSDSKNLENFWGKVMEADPSGLIKGYQPIKHPTGEVGIRALIDKGGLGTKKKLDDALQPGGSFDTMLSALPFKIHTTGAEAEISKAKNDWKEQPNGQSYLEGLGNLLGANPAAHLDYARSQLEKELEQHLDEAHAAQKTSWRDPQSVQSQNSQFQKQVISPEPFQAMRSSGGRTSKTVGPDISHGGPVEGDIVRRALNLTRQDRR
jgi:hypothetical protein